MQGTGKMEELARISLTPDGKAPATGKKFSDDSLMDSMPSLGRYSSLPNRHVLKQKSRSAGLPHETLKPKCTTSCFEVCESHIADIWSAQTSLPVTESHPDDACGAIILDDTVCSDIVHADTCHDNIQQAEAHYIDVDCATGDSEFADDVGTFNRTAVDNSTRKTFPSFERFASLPTKKQLKDQDYSVVVHSGTCRPDIMHANLWDSNIQHDDMCSDIQLSATAKSEEPSSVEGGHNNHGRAPVSCACAVDRIAVDDFVMSVVPSFGRYTSLPRMNSFQQINCSSPSRFSQQTQNSKNRSKPCNKEQCLAGTERITEDSSYHRPLSDDIDLRRLSERCNMPTYQSKSYGNIDVIERQEPFHAWLPLKHFEDSLKEFVTDSAYQTSDTLKLQMCSLSKEELRSRIENINLSQDGFKINMDPESDVYHGCIRVLIDLIQPVDIRISEQRPLFTSDDSQAMAAMRSEENKALPEYSPVSPFYLPRSYLATVHISSETTADQVIKDVLNKYNITNHSGRFALFEKINRKPDEGHSEESSSTVYLRKLAAKERPLELCLHSVDENMDAFEQRQFLLRENDNSDILWEAFSLPELNMFLDILLWEEESYIKAIRQKYASLRTALEGKLDLELHQNYDFLSRIQSPRNKLFEQGDD